MKIRALTSLGIVGAIAVMALGATIAPPFARTSDGGKSLVVSAENSSKGTAYHALPGGTRQIFFQSDAPLEAIKGQSNQVIGYTIVARGGANLVGGEWHLPVNTMKTGIALRDEHLAGGDWLNSKKFPNIVFQLKKTEGVTLVKEAAGFSTYEGTLVGDLTVHGVTRPVSLPKARFTFMPASAKTAGVADGDLLAVRAKISLRLSDFDISHPVIGKKVAEVVEIDVSLIHATVAPESQSAR